MIFTSMFSSIERKQREGGCKHNIAVDVISGIIRGSSLVSFLAHILHKVSYFMVGNEESVIGTTVLETY